MPIPGILATANQSPRATGGTVSTSGSYKIHSFTGSSTFVFSKGVLPVEYLITGAGGGGGAAGYGGGGNHPRTASNGGRGVG
jgi:hypothetical protein